MFSETANSDINNQTLIKFKEYQKANKDKIAEHKKQYEKANKESISIKNKARYQAKKQAKLNIVEIEAAVIDDQNIIITVLDV